ncbi:hypothetical protein ACFSTH_11620 [Paenibacillus yanchengensis]
MGKNDNFIGSPIIENGIITGYIGKNGPFKKKEANYWQDVAVELLKGTATGTADSFLGPTVAGYLTSHKPITADLPSLGINRS